MSLSVERRRPRSACARQRETRGSDRRRAFVGVDWLAWSMLLLTLLLLGAGALLALLSRSEDGGPELVGVRSVLLAGKASSTQPSRRQAAMKWAEGEYKRIFQSTASAI